MSRVILSRYPSGQERVTVGWDHPAGGAYFMEFTQEPADEEVLREGGMWPGIPLDKLVESMPEDLRPLMTDEVMTLLAQHRADPDSGYRTGPVDLSGG